MAPSRYLLSGRRIRRHPSWRILRRGNVVLLRTRFEERHAFTASCSARLCGRSIKRTMALMSEKHVRHLPVFEGKKLIGFVSIGDLVKSTIGDQKFLIDQLEHYIRGERAIVDG
jgi:CBS-domain-containing membrane protein